MDQIVNLIVEKTGISHEHARIAAETALGFLKKQLPAPIAGQIDSVLGPTGDGGSGGVADAAKQFGGMFGKQ